MADDLSLNPSRDDFAAPLDASMGGAGDFAEGTVINGIVVGIEKDFAIIDVGLKTEGRILIKEFGVDDAGKPTLKIGDSVSLSYVDQSREALNGEFNVWEEISDGGKDLVLVGKREMNSRAYCGAFNFKGSDQQEKGGLLSRGGSNRVPLAQLLRAGRQRLLPDETPEHLDRQNPPTALLRGRGMRRCLAIRLIIGTGRRHRTRVLDHRKSLIVDHRRRRAGSPRRGAGKIALHIAPEHRRAGR